MLKKPSIAAFATLAFALAMGCAPVPGGPTGAKATRTVTVKGTVALKADRRLMAVVAPYTESDVNRLEVYLSRESAMPSWEPSMCRSDDPMGCPSFEPSTCPSDAPSPCPSDPTMDPSWNPSPPGDYEPVPEWQTFVGTLNDVWTPIVLRNLKMDSHYRVHLRAFKGDGMGGWKRIDQGYMASETDLWTTNDDLIEGYQFNLGLRDQEFRGTASGGVNVTPGIVVDNPDPEGLVSPPPLP